MSYWFLGCCQQFLPSNYQQDRTESVFSVKHTIPQSSDFSVCTTLHCFVLLCIWPQRYSRYLPSKSTKPGLARGTDHRVFQSRLWKISPFSIPCHTERSQHLERTAKGIPGFPHAVVENTELLQGLNSPAEWPRGPHRHWGKSVFTFLPAQKICL